MERKPFPLPKVRDLREEAGEELWNNWHWQMANRITEAKHLEQVVDLTKSELAMIKRSLNVLRMAITPYFASLINRNDPSCPIRKQCIPTLQETLIVQSDQLDPLHEEVDSPVPGLTHRYPDRCLLLVTDQ